MKRELEGRIPSNSLLTAIDNVFQTAKLKLGLLLNFETMPKKQIEKSIKTKDVENLLNAQTSVILSAVDEKISKLDRRISKLEIKVDRRFDQLITTLDKFLKRLTDFEDEFEIMKFDINRLKKVIREKLGVDLL